MREPGLLEQKENLKKGRWQGIPNKNAHYCCKNLALWN